MFLIGPPFYVAVLQLPQRFQTVNHTSGQRAGILLLPMMLMTPVGAMFGSAVVGKVIPAEYCLVLASVIQTIGIGLLSSLSSDARIHPPTYGYEIITGFGQGLASSPVYWLLGTIVNEEDVATGTGAMNMLRSLGGSIGVAICSALFNSSFRSEVGGLLTSQQISAIEKSIFAINDIPQDIRSQLGASFSRIYNKQFRVMIAFTALNFVVTVLLVIVRKRDGTFGGEPQRTASNEFQKRLGDEEEPVKEEKHSDADNQTEKNGAQITAAPSSTTIELEEKDKT